MKTYIRITLCFIITSIGISSLSFGQTEPMGKAKKSADDIARELANPNATLGAIICNVDQTWYNGDLPDAGNQWGTKLALQPSLPYPISSGVNIFVRPLIPVYFRQPVYQDSGFVQTGFNLGDISMDVAIGKTWKSGWVTMVGIFASFPSATNDALSANQVILGPEAVIGYGGRWGFVGVLVTQGWGLTSDDEKRASSLGGQYFMVINLGKGWQFNCQPVFSYNWNASKGNRLTLPAPLGIKKTLPAGNMFVNLTLQYYYYVASPDNFGPQHQIRLVVTPIIKLPW